MEDLTTTPSQVEKLKLNVTNIKSFLTDSNSQIRRIDAKKSLLISKQIEDKKRIETEKKIETKTESKLGIGTKILKNVTGMVTSIKDRILNFFGYLLLGFIIEKLPQIIENISSFLKTVAPVVTGTIAAFGTIATGIGSVYNSISSIFNPESSKKNIDQSEKELKNLDREMGNSDEVTVPNIPFTPVVPGSMYPATTPSEISPLQSSPVSPQPIADSSNNLKIQKRKTGGSVNSQSQANQQPKRSSVGNDKTNPIKLFAKSSNENSESIKIYDNNINKFEEIVKVLKGLKKIDGILKPKTEDLPPGPPGERTPFDPYSTPIDVDKTDVIGTVGSTGRSFGPHIHIESYSKGGEAIPANIKNNILVSGVPMTRRLRFESPIGWRESTQSYHAGEDYSGEPNQPISLTGGLKYVGYVKMGTDDRFAGYGNVVVIQDKNGKKYFLAHLNSGPRNERELVKRQIQQRDPVASTASDLLKILERPGTPGPKISPVERSNGARPISVPLGELESKILIQPVIGPGGSGYGNGTPQSNQPQPLSSIFNWNNKGKSNLLQGIP